MSGKSILPQIRKSAVIAVGIMLCSTVNAEFYYPQPAYNHAADQNNNQQQAYTQEVLSPPQILPYVPFDNKHSNHRPAQYAQQAIVIPQPVQHYQAQPKRQQQPARTWRRTPATSNPTHLATARQRVIKAANRQLGTRYRWGGNTPRQGFDCSGFTKHAMRGSNINIPRTAAQQSRASRTINRSQLRPGDMIFFKTSGRRVNHVGIYLGNGRFIHAASGGGRVMTDDLHKAYWQKRLHKYGTFFS